MTRILPFLILAAVCFALIGDWPYSAYRMGRWVVMLFSLWAVSEYHKTRPLIVVPMVALAVLFNPIAPIHFKRPTWQALDGLAGVVFLATGFYVRRATPSAP